MIKPIVKTLRVDCPVADAFRIFTADIGSWWQTETHAIHPGKVREVFFEEREGGEVCEVSDDGVRAHWATVIAWEPPSRVVLAWHVDPEMPEATEVEVTFRPDGGGTRVELEHRHWERLGEAAAAARHGYDSGWEPVLAGYEIAVGERSD